MNQTHWTKQSNIKPWFDQPSALEKVNQLLTDRNIDSDQAELLIKWINNGYVVIKNCIPESKINELNNDLESSLKSNHPIENLVYLGMLDDQGQTCAFEHKNWIKLSEAERKNRIISSNFRIHDFGMQSQSAKDIFKNEKLIEACSLIFQKPAKPRSTINFYRGSAQLLHQDLAVFHIFPENYLIGAWIACEDIHVDSGPLSYCPGSHKEQLWSGFPNYPQTTLRTCTDKEHDDYHEWVQKTSEKYENKKFIAKKGDVLLWHALLFHGGSKINTPELTRKSFVIHYTVDGVDQTPHIKGPFRWS